MFGIGLLMVANGLLGSLLGIRAETEDFGTAAIGIIMSGFYAGLLAGSLWTPQGVRLVGHVRVFAAMSAVASVAVLLHSVFIHEAVWWFMRFFTGFCYAGVFVVAESWLNAKTTQSTRGQVLALYMAVSFGGMGSGQFLLNLSSSQGADLFILVSVLISLAVVPLLLRATPQPATDDSKPVSLKRLAQASPLGFFGVFIAGIVNGTIFGMAAVYARSVGLSVAETSLFVALLILGAALFQIPVGRLSDLIDRRLALTLTTFAAGGVALLASGMAGLDSFFTAALIAAAGGLSLSIHPLSLAYTNDNLNADEMVGASSGLVLLLGVGSILGPILAGVALGLVGASGYFLSLAAVHLLLGAFALFRMTRREAMPIEEQAPYVPAPPIASDLVLVASEEVSAELETESKGEDAAGR